MKKQRNIIWSTKLSR